MLVWENRKGHLTQPPVSVKSRGSSPRKVSYSDMSPILKSKRELIKEKGIWRPTQSGDFRKNIETEPSGYICKPERSFVFLI